MLNIKLRIKEGNSEKGGAGGKLTIMEKTKRDKTQQTEMRLVKKAHRKSFQKNVMMFYCFVEYSKGKGGCLCKCLVIMLKHN